MLEIDVFIEIPYLSNLKYEYDYKNKKIRLDRVLKSSMIYPGNYGYIENTLAEDGDALDVLLITDYPLHPGIIVKSKIIGALIMRDESGLDEKIIAVPIDSVDNTYSNIKDIKDIHPNKLETIKHFFKYYKLTDKTKWSKVDDFVDNKKAEQLVIKYQNKFKGN